MLKDLLAERNPADATTSGSDPSRPQRRSSTHSTRPRSSTIRELSAEAGDDVKEEANVTVAGVVGEVGDSSEDDEGTDGLSARKAGKRRASKRRAKASYELAGAPPFPAEPFSGVTEL